MKNKNLLSVLVVSTFLFLALASSPTKYMSPDTFSKQYIKVEDEDNRNYLQKNDGTKIYGNEIKWQSGSFVKDLIIMDGEKYQIADIRGYKKNNSYYGRLTRSYMKRLVAGAVNIYEYFYYFSPDPTRPTITTFNVKYFMQKGDSGEMKYMSSFNDLRDFLADCPAATAKLNGSAKEIRRLIASDPLYLNNIVKLYNTRCAGK